MSVILKVFMKIIMFLTLTVMPVSEPLVSAEEEPHEWQEETRADGEDGFTVYENRIHELTGGHVYTDSGGYLVPDPMYLPQPDFGTLSKTLFVPGWMTEDGNYILGSTAIVKVNDELPCVGLTALHCLNIYRSVSGMEVPDYIQGGALFNAHAPEEEAVTEIVREWAIPNAECLTAGKDVVAYEVDDLSDINVLPLAQGTCEQGEVIYLYANLVSEEEDIIDTFLYPCVVTYDDGVRLNYVFSEEFNTSGASGSPLLNNQGEVVGIHIGSEGSIRIGNSADSIRSLLIEAYEYNK